MKRILLGFLIYLIIHISVANANTYDVTLVRVVDGDTVYLEAEIWPDTLQFVRLRILGIDTPEVRRVPDCEKVLGIKARQFLINHLKNKELIISDITNDAFGGRVDGKLYANGALVSRVMLDSGHAVPYVKGSKFNWCL